MDWEATMRDMRRHLQEFNKTRPEAAKGFANLSKGALEHGVLDHKTKELVALGIAVSTRCEPCVGFHVESLIVHGATREEVADVLAVCVQMGGGPSLMYAAKALDAWDQFNAED
jgi:AhpD family alkylhydroperoxidase